MWLLAFSLPIASICTMGDSDSDALAEEFGFSLGMGELRHEDEDGTPSLRS